MHSPDERILRTWHANVAPWTDAVRRGEIASRVAVTNAAIMAAIRSHAPRRILDLGCGEGWICHEVARDGIAAIGVDAIPGLIDAARGGHPVNGAPATYAVHTYEAIAAGALIAEGYGAFDLIVCNFALFGNESVGALLQALPASLGHGGRLIIQTLHPVSARGDLPYQDGWREGSWAGFSDAFTDPAPWYFRTIGSWVALLRASGFALEALHEPCHPDTGAPSSLLLTLRVDPFLGAARTV